MAKDLEKLQQILKRYTYAKDRWNDVYQLARDDRNFLIPGGQWDDATRHDRENDPTGSRPCLESPRLEQYIRQVVNDARQNTPSIRFRPTKEGSSEKVAEILNDIVRSDQDASGADSAYDQSLEDGVRSSFGFFRMLTDYEDDSTLNQRVRFKSERNPLAITIDPDFTQLDASDIKYAFVEAMMTREAFEDEFPDADKVSFGDYSDTGWCDEDAVRVCEYYEVSTESETLYFDQFGNRTTEGAKGSVSRASTRKKVRWYKLTGAEILEEREVAGEYIPVVPCFGRMLDVEGKLNLLSLIRPAKDSQRMYNYAASAMTERITLAPKNKILADAESVEGFEDQYRSAHVSNDPLLMYNGKDSMGQPLQPPRMIEGASNPQQWVALLQHANNDIQASMGMYNSSLGAKSNETSGRAIMARQREGDVSTFDFIDNLARAVRYAGRVWLSMFIAVTDTTRVIRTVSEDGKSDFVIIDPTLEQAYVEKQGPNGEKVRVINPRIGQYDVTVVSGPSFTTKRDEAANFYTEIMRTAPNTAPALLPILMGNLDSPGADKAQKVLKAMLPPQIQAAMEDDDAKPQIPPQVQGQLQQMQTVIQKMQEALQEAQKKVADAELQAQESEARAQRLILQAEAEKSDNQLKAAESLAKAENDAKKLQIEAFDAETNRLKALQAGITPEQVQMLVLQTIQQLLPQPMAESYEAPEPAEIMEAPESGMHEMMEAPNDES